MKQGVKAKQKSIYGTTQYCDFIIYDNCKHPEKLFIEAKWQQKAEQKIYSSKKYKLNAKYPKMVEGVGFEPT